MKPPQDSYALVSTSLLDPPRLPIPPTPLKGSTSAFERFLHGLFLLLVILAGSGFLVWLEARLMAEVVSRQSIGRFVRMSGAGGLVSAVVIETERGSYVLYGTPAIVKGTLLFLEVRATGTHYICDESRSLCLETSPKNFKANDVQLSPIPPTPTSAQGPTP